MAKYTFTSEASQVLPKNGTFSTNSSASNVDYDAEYDDGIVELRIGTQLFDQEDLEDLIEFLESLKEHLKNG